MNIKSPLPGNNVGYEKEGKSVCIFFGELVCECVSVCVCGVIEYVAREIVQMKV